MSALIVFFIFSLNAEQMETQKHQEAKKNNSVSKNSAALFQKTDIQVIPIRFENSGSYRGEKTEKLKQDQYKTNEKKLSVLKTSQKSGSALSDKETSAPPESDKESLSSADNKKPSPSAIDNIEKKSPSQSIQSIDSETPPLFENSKNEEPPSTHSEEEKTLSQPDSRIEKKIPPSKPNENTEKPAQKPPFSIELEAEGSLIQNLLSKNQKGFYPHIPYIELSFERNILSNLQFFTELEFDSRQNSWGIELEQAGLFYHSNRLDLKMGRIPVSLGYSYANSNLFVKPLSLYKLFRANPMDIGLRLTVPLYKKYLNLSFSRFKGYLKRTFDNFYKPPEFAPMTISLKGKGSSWNAFITYLKQDLAFQEPLNALGGGFTFSVFSLSESFISLQGEIWGSGEKLQNSFSYYLFPKVSFNKYEWGALFGEIKNFAPNFKNPEIKSSIYEWVLQGSYELFPGVFLIGERFITKQKKGPLINNIWALRLKTKMEF